MAGAGGGGVWITFYGNKMVFSQFTKNKIGNSRFTENKKNVLF